MSIATFVPQSDGHWGMSAGGRRRHDLPSGHSGGRSSREVTSLLYRVSKRVLAAISAFGLAATIAAPAPAYAAKYASIIIDANTDRVLYARNADKARYPASLTKMMTLYIVFDMLKQKRITYDTPIRISRNAASKPPSKLGLSVGQTIRVKDAIRALVTKSANDVAAAIADQLGGTEAAFARVMTQKARELGMLKTTFRNASGLPNWSQVTTARDMTKLAQALIDDHPLKFRMFKTRYFKYRGRSYRNHNSLLYNFQGTDGIKTGYTRASGFNLVSSVRRGRKHLIGVVMGASSGGKRNAHMRSILRKAFRKTSRVARRSPPKRASRTLMASLRPAPKRSAMRRTRLARAVPAPRRVKRGYTRARARPRVPANRRVARIGPAAVWAPKPKVRRVAVRRVPVQRIRMARNRAPNYQPHNSVVAPRDYGSGIAVPMPQRLNVGQAWFDPSELGSSAASVKAFMAGRVDVLPVQQAAYRPTPQRLRAPARQRIRPARIRPSAPAPVERARKSNGTHQVQVGAFATPDEANRALDRVLGKAGPVLEGYSPVTTVYQTGTRTYYRARFAGFRVSDARSACSQLKRVKIDCMVLRVQ